MHYSLARTLWENNASGRVFISLILVELLANKATVETWQMMILRKNADFAGSSTKLRNLQKMLIWRRRALRGQNPTFLVTR